MNLSQTSTKRLKGIHPDLVKVVKRAAEITDIDFIVTEGLRSVEQQRKNVDKGVSTTMNSRHLTGHAVDISPLVDGKISWDWPLYYKLAKVVKRAAKDVGVTVEWGGDWKTFKDGPHWQLPFSKYPKNQKFGAEVDSAKPYTLETDKQAQGKALAALGTGATTATTVSSDAAVRAFDAIVNQQSELTSGDYIRIGVALLIVAGTFWYAYKKWS